MGIKVRVKSEFNLIIIYINNLNRVINTEWELLHWDYIIFINFQNYYTFV